MDFFHIRPGRPTDYAYITEYWYTSARKGHDGGPHYTPEMKAHIEASLAKASTCSGIRVAADKEDDDAIHGWAVVTDLDSLVPVIRYVFVRPDSRQLGVGKALVADLLDRACLYTARPLACLTYHNGVPHCTMPDKCLACKIPKPSQWTYNLFAGFR